VDDRGIHDRALAKQQSPLAKMGIDRFQQLARQIVLFQQATEFQDRCLVRQRIIGQVQPCEAAHGFDLIQRIFHARIAQHVPLLHEVDAQHRAQGHRWAATATRFPIVRFDDGFEKVPRNDLFHLRQEHLAPRSLLLGVKAQRGEGGLFHGRGQRGGVGLGCIKRE
jgi:hypothetical protein